MPWYVHYSSYYNLAPHFHTQLPRSCPPSIMSVTSHNGGWRTDGGRGGDEAPDHNSEE